MEEKPRSWTLVKVNIQMWFTQVESKSALSVTDVSNSSDFHFGLRCHD